MQVDDLSRAAEWGGVHDAELGMVWCQVHSLVMIPSIELMCQHMRHQTQIVLYGVGFHVVSYLFTMHQLLLQVCSALRAWRPLTVRLGLHLNGLLNTSEGGLFGDSPPETAMGNSLKILFPDPQPCDLGPRHQ